MHPLLISLCLCSLGLIAVLLVRKAARSVFGPGPAFSLWLLPPLLALTPWLPAIPAHWSTPQAIATLPGVRTLFIHVTANATAPASTHWLLWIWIGGSALLGLRMLAHYIRVRRSSAAPAPHMLGALHALMNRRDLQRVRMHSMGPAVLWSARSQVLLPADFLDRFTPQQRRAVVAHECMHLRRGDAWWNLLAELGLAVLWFHPLAWLALPRLRLDMELACDAAVLRRRPREHAVYAQALLSNAGVHAQAQLVAWLNPPQLKERLIMISRPQNSSLRRRCGYLVLAAILATCSVAAQTIASTPDGGSHLSGDARPLGVTGNGALSPNKQNIDPAQPQARLAIASSTDSQQRVLIVVDPHMSLQRRNALRQKMNQAGISHVEFTTNDKLASAVSAKDTRKVYTFDKDTPAVKGNSPPKPVRSSRVQNPPVYPYEAIKAKEQGTVNLRVHVTADGVPDQVTVAKSSGYQQLDQAAVEAAKKWQFNPRIRNDRPEPGWTQIKVNFSLEQ